MKKIWITADSPVGLTCPMGGNDYLHVAITRKMIDAGEAVEVPDNDFFNNKLREKLIRQVQPKAKPVKSPVKQEDKA